MPSDVWKRWSTQTLKQKTAKEFQKAVRYEAADESGMVHCVTCTNSAHYTNSGSEIHAGHFVSSRTNAVLFEENNVHPQCYRCNVHLHGNQEVYGAYMLDRYGPEEVERIRNLRFKTKTFSRSELNDMRLRYRQRWKDAEARIMGKEVAQPKLTAPERSDYRRLKKQAKDGLESGFSALIEIREQRLYREDYDTFEAFCQAEFGLTRQTVNRKLKAAEVKASLEPIGTKTTIPTNEGQLREVAKAPQEMQADVVERGNEIAALQGREPTAKDYAQAREEVVQPDPAPAPDWKKKRAKAVATAEALQREIDDLNDLRVNANRHTAALNSANTALVNLREWC